MRKNCKHCGTVFDISTMHLGFLDKVSPVFGGKTFTIPPPSLCPDCRKQRRLSFRNDFVFYYGRSDFSGQRILSIYSDEKFFPVFTFDEWWGDGWSPLTYGQEFDFSRPFFEQFAELRAEVPRINLYVDNLCENCEYSNQLTMSKRCYLVCSGSSNQDCFYSYRINNSRDCMDCLYCIDSELCYQCIDASASYGCRYCQNITNCSNSTFLFDCQSCESCMFCAGLRNKSYHLFNKPHTKAEFEELSKGYKFTSRSSVALMRQQFADFIRPLPRKFAYLKQVENVIGDNVQHARNCSYVFDGANLEDVHFAQFVQDSKDCMDVNYCCDNTTLHYEVSTGGIEAYNVAFSVDTWPTVSNLLYCDSCSNGTKDCFGCIGLRRAQYCILNKQYSPQDYTATVQRIIRHMIQTGEWGE